MESSCAQGDKKQLISNNFLSPLDFFRFVLGQASFSVALSFTCAVQRHFDHTWRFQVPPVSTLLHQCFVIAPSDKAGEKRDALSRAFVSSPLYFIFISISVACCKPCSKHPSTQCWLNKTASSLSLSVMGGFCSLKNVSLGKWCW